MKTNYAIAILIFLIFSISNIEAQNNFKSGFIVNTENDTILGFINDKVDSQLSDNIEFKKGKSDKVVVLTPNDIIFFQFESGRKFEKIYRKIDSSNIFGKKHIQGKIDLFIVRTSKGDKSEFYLRNNEIDKSVYLMPPNKRNVTKNGKEYVTKSNSTFNAKLKAIKEETSSYKPIKYKPKLIIKSVIDYNKKNNGNYLYELFEESIVTSFDVSVGTVIASRESISNLFRINVSRNVMNRDKNRRFSFYQNVNYTQFNDEYGIYGEPMTSYEEMYYVLRLIPVGFKFQTDTENVIPYAFASAGLAMFYVNDELDEGDRFGISPTLNGGVGLKVKIGANYIFSEVTAHLLEGLILNLGYSF